eukprot:gene29696-5129_t
MWRDYNSYLWITLTLDGLPDTQPYLPFEAPWNGVPASASLSISILGQFDPKLPTGYYDTFPLGLFGKFTCSSFALDLRSVCDPYSSVYIPGNFINLAQCRCTNGNYCPPMDLSASDKLYVSVQAEGPSGFQSNVAFRIFFAQPDGAVEYLYQTLNSVSICFMAHFTSPIVAQAVLSNYLPTRNPGAACGSSFVANAVCNDIFDIPRVEFNSSNLPFLFCPPPPPDLVPLPPSPPPRPPSPQTSSPNPPSPPPPNPPPSPFPPPLSGAVSIQIYGGEEALLGYCKSFLNTLSYFFRLSNKFPLTPATCFQVGTFSMVEATFANYDDAQYFTATLTSNMLFFVRTAGIPCGCSLVTAAPESLPIIQECSGQLPDLCCKPPPPGSLNPPPAPPPEDSVYTLIVEPPISIDGQIIEKIDLESVMCDRLRNGFEKFIRYTGSLCGSIIKWQPKGKRAMPLNYLFPAIAKNPDLAYCLHGLQLQEP